MARQRTIWCKHYRAPAFHKSCEAGVEYAKLPCHGTAPENWPCYYRPPAEPAKCCDLQVFPTAEEIAEEDRQSAIRFEGTMRARAAIVAHLGGPWKDGTPSTRGAIDCPVCKKPKALSFSRAGVNGHIHARCATPNCVAWME